MYCIPVTILRFILYNRFYTSIVLVSMQNNELCHDILNTYVSLCPPQDHHQYCLHPSCLILLVPLISIRISLLILYHIYVYILNLDSTYRRKFAIFCLLPSFLYFLHITLLLLPHQICSICLFDLLYLRYSFSYESTNFLPVT